MGWICYGVVLIHHALGVAHVGRGIFWERTMGGAVGATFSLDDGITPRSLAH